MASSLPERWWEYWRVRRPSGRVRTLVVCATGRGVGLARDQVEMLQWALVDPHHIVIVDGTVDAPRLGPALAEYDNVSVIWSTLNRDKRLSGFMNHEGIIAAIMAGWEFDQVLFIDDDTLLIGQGLDRWAWQVLDGSGGDLLGVRDRYDFSWAWTEAVHFFRHVPGSENWLPPSYRPGPYGTTFYAAVFVRGWVMHRMMDLGLLVPENWRDYRHWPDQYISWCTDLLGGRLILWGSMERPKPPLWLEHPDKCRDRLVDPRHISPDFLAFHSVSYGPVSEWEIREHYRQLRAG